MDLRKESLWVMCNGITGADYKIRNAFLEKGSDDLISSIIQGLAIQDGRLLQNLLETTDALLQLDEFYQLSRTEQSIALAFERNGGLDALEETQKHPNKTIYDMSVKILTTYFQPED